MTTTATWACGVRLCALVEPQEGRVPIHEAGRPAAGSILSSVGRVDIKSINSTNIDTDSNPSSLFITCVVEESTFTNEFSNESSELVSKSSDMDTTFPNGGAFPFPGTSREGAVAREAPVDSLSSPTLLPFLAIGRHSGDQELSLSPRSYP